MRGEGTREQKRKYLVECGEECAECGQGVVWNNKPLTLHVDHIDGNSDNNEIDNLQFLCPHCHSQTDTYGNTGIVKDTKRNKYLRKYKTNMLD